MKISIIHPSRSRSRMAFRTALRWLGLADDENEIEYILSLDTDDPEISDYEDKFSGGGVTIMVGSNSSAIQAINEAAEISSGDLIIVVSDDFDCPDHWDTLLAGYLRGQSDFVVKTQDGIQPTLITLPIMDRVYYERFGYIYYPDYKHMFCDQEMTAIAIMTGKYIKLPISFPHNHYTTGKMPKDQVNDKNNATWNQGEKLFKSRLRKNFGLRPEQIVKPYSQIRWK